MLFYPQKWYDLFMEITVHKELQDVLSKLKKVRDGESLAGHDVLIEVIAKLETLITIYSPDEIPPSKDSWFSKFRP
jgi:hypothetical protein